MEKQFTLLVATDYSESTLSAERYAVQFAKNTGSLLKFLHVFESYAADQTGAFDANKIDYNPVLYEMKKLKSHVEKVIETLNFKPGDITYECLIREGKTATQIREEAKETSYDFIIIGTHDITGFRRLFSGSNTWNVIKKTGTPVLAIPGGTSFREIKNIVFATEYREGELPVINFLAELAKTFNAELTILHISANIISEEFEKELSTSFTSELKNKITYRNIKLQTLHYTDIISGIDDFCARSHADWLVMSPERPFFIDKIFHPSASITKQMSFKTNIPLLSIPDYYNPDNEWFWKLFMVDYSLNPDF